jgi:hypothetical protein
VHVPGVQTFRLGVSLASAVRLQRTGAAEEGGTGGAPGAGEAQKRRTAPSRDIVSAVPSRGAAAPVIWQGQDEGASILAAISVVCVGSRDDKLEGKRPGG